MPAEVVAHFQEMNERPLRCLDVDLGPPGSLDLSPLPPRPPSIPVLSTMARSYWPDLDALLASPPPIIVARSRIDRVRDHSRMDG